MRMRFIVICGLSGSTIFFPHYFVRGTIFEKQLLDMKCVFLYSLQFLSEKCLIIRSIQRDMTKNVFWFSCKVTVIFVRFLMKLEFSQQIF